MPSSHQQLIDALQRAQLINRLSSPSDQVFKESIDSYWSNQESEVKPAYVIRPQTVQEVANVVQILSSINEADGFSTPFAVRGGGHQTWPGSANIQDGVTVDLRSLNTIEIDNSANTVTAGPGCYWKDVYEALDGQGRTTPGARVLNCGVAGLCLGGGISYYSPKLGFVCDNIVSFQVVLADGTVIEANQNSQPELWKCLKGGGNNFGVVTAFTMRTFPAEQIYGGTMVHGLDTVPRQLDIFHKLTSGIGYDDNAIYLTAASFHHEHGLHAFNSLKYTSPNPDAPPFKPYADVPCFRSTMRLGSLKDMIAEEGALQWQGYRRMFMTTTFYNDLDMLTRSYEIWTEKLEQVKSVQGCIFPLVFNPIFPIAVERGARQGGNVLGLDGLAKPLVVATLCVTWDLPEDDKKMVQSCREIIAKIDADAQKAGVYHPYKYMNYGWDGQEVIKGYGPDSIALMRKVSKQLDPRQIFQRAVPGGFKIPSEC